MSTKDINIGIVGGSLVNRKEMFIALYNHFNENKISIDTYVFNEKPNPFKSTFNFNDIKINVFFNIRDKYIKFENTLDKSEKESEVKRNFLQLFGTDLHFGICINSEKVQSYYFLLLKQFQGSYVVFNQNIEELYMNSESPRIFQFIKDNEEKAFKYIENEIINIRNKMPLYEMYLKYTKEKYYIDFLSYYQRYNLYSKLSIDKLTSFFNGFEQFSFDAEDYNDDSIMILQILTEKKASNISLELRKNKCNSCGLSNICKYFKSDDKFYCDNCMNLYKNKNNTCSNCKILFTNYNPEILPLCCRHKYCTKCLKKQIDYSRKQNPNNIKCFCGTALHPNIIESLSN